MEDKWKPGGSYCMGTYWDELIRAMGPALMLSSGYMMLRKLRSNALAYGQWESLLAVPLVVAAGWFLSFDMTEHPQNMVVVVRQLLHHLSISSSICRVRSVLIRMTLLYRIPMHQSNRLCCSSPIQKTD